MEGFLPKGLALGNHPAACHWFHRWPRSLGPCPRTHSPAPSGPVPTPPTTRHLAEHVILLPTAKGELY